MEYKLITKLYTSELQKEVNKLLSEGWKLHGPTTSVVKETWAHFKKYGEDVIYSQALTKE
jgi:hypothetical protein